MSEAAETLNLAKEGTSKSILMNLRAAEGREVIRQIKEEVKKSGKGLEASEATVNEIVPEARNDRNKKESKKTTGKLAVVLVRGMVKVTKSVKDTVAMLRLNRKNNLVVITDSPVHRGMLNKVKDHVTWGEISDEIFSQMVSKRGEEYKSRLQDRKGRYSYHVLEVNGRKYKPYFRLNPPRKGFGRKGIKMPFKLGGGLGYRGEKMDDLIIRMM